jgi:hypothetical protein
MREKPQYSRRICQEKPKMYEGRKAGRGRGGTVERKNKGSKKFSVDFVKISFPC